MMRVGEHRTPIASRLWLIAALTAVGAIGAASQAEAARYDRWDSDHEYYQPRLTDPQWRQEPRLHQARKVGVPEKESAKPQGPLIIAISIEKQNLKIYDANGFFAETPVSTGMKGHPTPNGVFSVIQKHKLHHSNIYSGAPMPYMQRITWSGVAMHAGVLPGYPASHGCIRMPMAFAVKMWTWSKVGARVVVTPGEITPTNFSHPLLATQKVAPQPITGPQADTPPTARSDKASNVGTAITPVTSGTSFELRSTVGHIGGLKSAKDEPTDSRPLRNQTHTADASGDMQANKFPVTMIDASPSGGNSDKPAAAAQANGNAVWIEAPAVASVKPEDKADEKKTETTADTVKAAINVGTSATDVEKDDIKKTQARMPDPATSVTTKRTGQIAVFVSGKDSRLYVRQNFVPLFDVPVIIAPSDRPLGTHVFTAQINKHDSNLVHWSAISLPAPEKHDEGNRFSRRQQNVNAAVEAKLVSVPDSPAEALDRLSIPEDAMARIVEAISTGSSIIVSDQGISPGETGEGTDFIISLR